MEFYKLLTTDPYATCQSPEDVLDMAKKRIGMENKSLSSAEHPEVYRFLSLLYSCLSGDKPKYKQCIFNDKCPYADIGRSSYNARKGYYLHCSKFGTIIDIESGLITRACPYEEHDLDSSMVKFDRLKKYISQAIPHELRKHPSYNIFDEIRKERQYYKIMEEKKNVGNTPIPAGFD
jgi:hypothetical protein